ncbi:MAG: cytochrome c oxidase subunit 3 family protein [Sphingomonadales bacterium]|nr:MAG: cytochrome c oxidase subunit 3 family protein [Sphingomonadales bacterium]
MSGEARSRPVPGSAGGRTGGHIPGEAGVWILILGEMSFFAALFAAFLHYRGFEVASFTASQAALSKPIGLTNTLLLLSSSLFVAFAVRAVAQGRPEATPRLFAAGLLCALGFILLKGVEYYELLSQGIAVNSNTFFGFYFALTALHLVHVVIGSGVLIALAAVSRRPLAKPSHFALIESGGCFWHMVDLLWIIIFPLLYLVE